MRRDGAHERVRVSVERRSDTDPIVTVIEVLFDSRYVI